MQDDSSLPIIAITMGDPGGVGPEILVKAMASYYQPIRSSCRPLVIGSLAVMEPARNLLNSAVRFVTFNRSEVEKGIDNWPLFDGAEGFDQPVVPILNIEDNGKLELVTGVPSAAAGRAAYAYIECAAKLALANAIQGIATCPISKTSLKLAGIPHTGHTEILAHLTGSDECAMLLVVDHLRVAHVTTHMPLSQVVAHIKCKRVLNVIRMLESWLRTVGIERPKIAVAGLNPHAGENGYMGKEELTEIGPAVSQGRSEGIDVVGPLPGDSVFSAAQAGVYDGVVAMYHDQGHIPVKMVGFISRPTSSGSELPWQAVSGVNVTLGLPIIRTSVDHGVAYDLVGTGRASETSLVEAILLATKMAKRVKKNCSGSVFQSSEYRNKGRC